VVVIFTLVNSPLFPLLTTLVSERTEAHDQGAILGINQSYQSLGQIAGPLMAGVVVKLGTRWVFWMAAGLMLLAAIVGSKLNRRFVKVEVA
jgi:DHA1 family multidrug resistance protein-like MFS transporter